MEDPLDNIDPLSLMNHTLDEAKIKDNQLPQNLHVVCKDEGKAELSPWLMRTGWKDTFQGKDMSELVLFTKKDKGQDHVIAFIEQSVPRMINYCMKGVKDLRSRGWDEIRFWLMSLDKEKASPTPFRLDYQDLTSYTEVWKRLLFFCWRTFDVEESGAQFTTDQRGHLYDLRRLSFDATEEMIDEIIVALSISLIMHSDYDKPVSVIKYFSGVMGYNLSQARWKRPREYTPSLAPLQFCIRVISLEHCLPLSARDHHVHNNLVPTPQETFRRFHSLWLVDGGGQPMSYIHKLLNYGLKASQHAKGGDNIRFSPDKKRCFYDGNGFAISDWKEMMNDITRNAESILSRHLLFRDSDTIDPINPYDINDSKNDSTAGDYFASRNPDFKDNARRYIMVELCKSDQWKTIMDVCEGKMVMKKEAMDEYTKYDTQFREMILLAINWTCGQTGRGTEMLSLLYKNKMSAMRNVMIEDGQIVIETEYHKSQNITDDIKVYPHRSREILIIGHREIPPLGCDQAIGHVSFDRRSFP
jgi:hypothetical protein